MNPFNCLLQVALLASAASAPIDNPSMVELVKTHSLKEMPAYGREGDDYYDVQCAFASDQTLQVIHPLKFGGELCTCTLKDGKVQSIAIPEPKGVMQDIKVYTYFDNSKLWVAPKGDRLIRWDIKGTNDNGLAFLKRDAASFVTARADLYYENLAITAPDGTWYLLVWNANVPQGFKLSIYQVGEKLDLKRLGGHGGLGHHSVNVLDGAFVSKDVVHVVWAEVRTRGNWLRLKTNDFDIEKKSWSEEQDLFRLDSFVSAVHPALITLKDGSVHYFWEIDEGQKKTEATGLYYQPKGSDKPEKIEPESHGFKTLVLGNRIVVCYTLEAEPNKVFFRVITEDKPGPVSELRISNKREHRLWGDRIVLGRAGDDRIWFLNTLEINTLYELKLADVK